VNEYELAIRRQLRQRLIDAVASWPGQARPASQSEELAKCVG